MKIHDMKIGAKLGWSFGLVLCLMVLVGAVGFWGVKALQGETIGMLKGDAQIAQHSARARANVLGMRRYEKDCFINIENTEKRDEYYQKWTGEVEKVEERIVSLEKVVVKQEDIDTVKQMKENLALYVAGFNKVFQQIRYGAIKTTADANAAVAEYKDETHKLEKLAQDFATEGNKRMDGAEKVVNDKTTKTVIFMSIIILLSAVCGVTAALIITRMITVPLQIAVGIAQRVSSGDLTAKIEVTSADETGQLLQALKDMNENLAEMVSEVRESSDSIATATKQIASGNSDLSQRTEEQASALEETASSMEELTSTVKQNAENSQQANQLAAAANDVATKGGNVIKRVVGTMESITESSKKISDIIGVIDGIAFQTNILALNAAVEAARAGEQGRGFAVVAGEVRNLAQRSAAAAKEIKSLINDSVDKVDGGAKLVGEAGQTIQEIVVSVKRVTDIMAEITAASVEQSSGIEQVNQAINQMDEVTQQNASLVEEAAAAAESLEEQAENLVEVMRRFKLSVEKERSLAKSSEHKHVKEERKDNAPHFALRRGLTGKPGARQAKKVALDKSWKGASANKAASHDEEWKEF